MHQAKRLIEFDHFIIRIEDKDGVMLTYPWMEEGLSSSNEPFVLRVVFEHVAGHPTAPSEIQELVDQLKFVTNDNWLPR
ncbi:MAG: hypothetical protein GKR91_12550 [Pseudomonadales bacterium]|nr:hypothetical protein [Pseudomonadales bacterium]